MEEMTIMSDLVVQAEGLRKRFGRTQALDGVDLAVRRGTVLGVLGPNGAGKTTAVRVLATLLRPDSGSAQVAGIDVLRQPDRVRRRIGLTGQYASVDEDLTGTRNLVLIGQLLDLTRRDARRRAEELLDWFGLSAAGQDVLRRDAPPPRPGGEPGRPPRGDLPRRADHRPRPGQA
jgi:oleandomycin transport system ATP-binding protein